MVLEEAPLAVRLILLCIKFKEGPGLRSEETAVLLPVGLNYRQTAVRENCFSPKSHGKSTLKEPPREGMLCGGDCLSKKVYLPLTVCTVQQERNKEP